MTIDDGKQSGSCATCQHLFAGYSLLICGKPSPNNWVKMVNSSDTCGDYSREPVSDDEVAT